MNKKGQDLGGEMLIWIVRLILVGILMLIIYFSFNMYLSREVRVNDMQESLTINRLLYGKDCLIYQDEIRAYPGIIDFNRFNGNLAYCLSSKKQGVILSLNEINNEPITEVIINEDVADLFVACKIKEKNFYCSSDSVYVLLNQNNQIRPALLNISMVILYE